MYIAKSTAPVFLSWTKSFLGALDAAPALTSDCLQDSRQYGFRGPVATCSPAAQAETGPELWDGTISALPDSPAISVQALNALNAQAGC